MAVSVNPATGQTLTEVPDLPSPLVERKLARADDAFGVWSGLPFDARAAALRRLSDVLTSRRDEYATLISLEMGKPITQARREIDKCALTCTYYADKGPAMLSTERRLIEGAVAHIRYEPLGIVLAVMPWNYPFWQVLRFLAPALITGNAVVLKHASNVPQCALAIEEAVVAAGVPEGVMSTVVVSASRVPQLLADERIRAVTLTGSSIAGAQVAQIAGGNLKKQVLELGGSDPFLVLADADVNAAARVAVQARFQNAGQTCVAAKRFLVAADVADQFLDALCAGVAELHLGDPLDERTTMGPLAKPEVRTDIERQVADSIALGAELRTGGAAVDGPGYFYLPTVLASARSDMPVFDEETFGPVAPVMVCHSDDHAVAVANDCEYGLGASIWSRDHDRAMAIATRLHVGNVFVNSQVSSHPAIPFGGTKHSGYGRELAEWGPREFVNVKSVLLPDDREAGGE